VVEIFTTAEPAGSLFGFSVGVLVRLRAVETLIPFLKHPKRQIRQEAASVLAHFSDPRSRDACVEGLSSEDFVVRTMCARVLGNLGAEEASGLLLAQLHDDSLNAREAAAGALGRIYKPRFLRPLARVARSDSIISVRDTASRVLIRTSRNPAAIRIGKRYKPWGLSPAQQPWILLGFGVRMALTSVALSAVALWLLRLPGRPADDRRRVMVTITVIAAGLGFLWGFVVDNIWGTLENILLLGVLPMTAGFGHLLVFLTGGRARSWLMRRWWWIVGCFYGGYVVGWLALWGYLGF
jgi:hypothetical protein